MDGSIDTQSPVIQVPDGGEPVWFTSNRIVIKVRGAETGGAFGLIEATAPPGASPPLHVHSREEESFWVLEGEVEFLCGEERFRAGPGGFALLPRGIPHSFLVVGDAPARFINVITPGGMEDFFARAGRPAEGPGLPPAGPPDIEALARAGEEFEIATIGPPMSPA